MGLDMEKRWEIPAFNDPHFDNVLVETAARYGQDAVDGVALFQTHVEIAMQQSDVVRQSEALTAILDKAHPFRPFAPGHETAQPGTVTVQQVATQQALRAVSEDLSPAAAAFGDIWAIAVGNYVSQSADYPQKIRDHYQSVGEWRAKHLEKSMAMAPVPVGP